MLQIEISQDIEAKLAIIAAHDGTSVDRATIVALEQFIQDREDAMGADEIMARSEPLIPWVKARKILGLDS